MVVANVEEKEVHEVLCVRVQKVLQQSIKGLQKVLQQSIKGLQKVL